MEVERNVKLKIKFKKVLKKFVRKKFNSYF